MNTEVVFFNWIDYSVFIGMLVLSALIGVYFAYFAKEKQNTTSEYLMGGKKMGIFPISMSLIASYISGISILGYPAEMYVYGSQFWLIIIPEVFVSVTMAAAYLPVFYKLQITSSYEYLNMRFSKTVCLFGSCLFIIKMLLYIPIVIYVPALAFSQVTGLNIHLITPLVSLVCIFYTTVGGLKAVVWTDTLQTILMIGEVFVVMVVGTIWMGGVKAVWEAAEASDRIEFFVFDIDPTIRHTFWSVLIGNYFGWLGSCSVNQAMVQRCLAMPTIRKANMTILILAVGIIAIVSMSCFTGLVIYAMFKDCDPVVNKAITKYDQVLPYFVMAISEKMPGLPGLFVAGVFSAALSSMSTGLNSMTGVIFEDFIRPLYKKPISEARASFIMKLTVFIIGIICVGLVFLVEKLNTLLQVTKSLTGITYGALLGMFSLGMFFPWANAAGCLAGGISSLVVVGWIVIGAQIEIGYGRIRFPRKPISVDQCPIKDNSTLPKIPWLGDSGSNALIYEEGVLYPYRLSYLWYTVIGCVICILIGLLVSFVTGPTDANTINPDLISPVAHGFLKRNKKLRRSRNTSRVHPSTTTTNTTNEKQISTISAKCENGVELKSVSTINNP